jgi:hypothetical protein
MTLDFPTAVDPLCALRITGVPLQYVVEWGRCGRTADYVADFFAYGFSDPTTGTSVLSTVVNELVENAVKFSTDKQDPFTLDVVDMGAEIVVRTTNSTTPDEAAALTATMDGLREQDAAKVLGERLEASGETAQRAGLGLLLIVTHYAARLGVSTKQEKCGASRLTVQVGLDAKEFESDGH